MPRGVKLGRRSRVDPIGRKRSGGNFRNQRTGVPVVHRRAMHERPVAGGKHRRGRHGHRRTKRRHGPR